MKRLLAAGLCLALLLLCAPAAFAEGTALRSGRFSYVLLDDGTAKLVQYTGRDSALEIPATLDGKTVTAIGDSAFAFHSELRAVTIPDSVTEIGAQAFYCCGRLESVTIPGGARIGDEAFVWCKRLAEVVILDGETAIGRNPFANCALLDSVTVSPAHPTLETRGGVLFSKADRRLVSCLGGADAADYAIPEGTEIIGDAAFFACIGLTAVTIPGSVREIGDAAFFSCHGLTAVTIPDSVTRIGVGAFCDCSRLADITIPASVTEIGDAAFAVCAKEKLFTVAPGSVAEQYCIENDFPYTA